MKKTIIGILIISMLCMFAVSCTQKEISDGIYSVDATLEGGSGRSKIEDATIEIADGEIYATVVWNSPFYEYMIVDDVKYSPIQTKGKSTFKIPVILDKKISVSASTVAMSQPYQIDYILFFDSKTLTKRD